MIASKQIAFGKAAGGNKLPDGVVPIEYLESTGTQYIDTGVVVDTTTIWRVNCAVTDTATQFMGVIDENTMRYHLSFYDLGVIKGCMGAMQSNIGTPNMEFNEYELNCTTKTASMNGISAECDYTKNAGKIPSLSIWLFGRNSDRDSYQRMINIKVGMSKIWKADTLVRDLIPVRKGNIGYMYDRVSGQLFGNSGTGEFVLGPDIIDYTAKDYVQDGLMFICDDRFTTEESKKYTFTMDGSIARGSDFTMELCCEIEDDGTIGTGVYARMLIGQTASSAQCLGFAWLASSAYNTLNLQSGSYRWSLKNQPIFSKNTWGLITENGDSPATSFVHGGVVTYAGPKYLSDWNLGNGFAVGKVVGNKNGFRGTVFNVRVYNRALTAEEIAHNYNIDKARFGL